MVNRPFTLRSDTDLVATFRKSEQSGVIPPRFTFYPFLVDTYFAWTDTSGAYTYIVYRKPEWETPRGLVFQKNGQGHANSPAGMCDWCHATGTSDQVGLMTTQLTDHKAGGAWLCLDLSCLQKIEEQNHYAGKLVEKQVQKLLNKIGQFFDRVWDEEGGKPNRPKEFAPSHPGR